jgi:predicted nucleic acid-binding protein
VRLVIADTGPVNYLILIGYIDLLPRLFERVVLPVTVQAELASAFAPSLVRRWIAAPPVWLEVAETPDVLLPIGIHKGEAAAIALATMLRADLLLIDDRKGMQFARKQGLRVTGTLGLLDRAAERGLIDFAQAILKLEQTTFRRPETLLEALLKKHRRGGKA